MADDYSGFFSGLENQYHLPSGYLAGMANVESSMGQTPDRPGSQYQGMFQLGSDVRNKYGITDPSNWQQNATGAAQYAADNMKQLTPTLGRAPTASELYLAHQQGAGGASSLIQAGDTPAGMAVPPAAISGNGGDPTAPASAFTTMWDSKFNKAMARGTTGSGQTAMSSYPPIGPNPSVAPAAAPQTASGLLAGAPDWVQTALKSPTNITDVQQTAAALAGKAPSAAPPPQPNLVQMGNQLSAQRQNMIQQRSAALLATLTNKRA